MSEEQIIFRGSPSLLTRFGALFLGFLILAAGAVISIMMHQPLVWILSGLALVYIIGVIVVVKATQYEVTNERVRIRSGIMTKRTEELELYRALDTSLIEPLTLRMFGLGTIEVRTADASSPTVYLHAIHNARTLREELRKSIEDCRDRKRVRLTEFDPSGPDAT